MSETKDLDQPQQQSTKVYPKVCPICHDLTNYVYHVHEARRNVKGLWYRCPCGVIFQSEYPKHDVYDHDYYLNYRDARQSFQRMTHTARMYAPIIEELTWGRMMLDVGCGTKHVMDFFDKRGWLTWGLDINKAVEGDNIYYGDFMEADFTLKSTDDNVNELIKEQNIKRTFNLIWMSHVLEHFNDPIAALRRAYDLLAPAGILFVAVPDIDYIHKTGIPQYSHWRANEHYVMWSERALVRELEKLNFTVIVKRHNFTERCMSWHDCQVVAQRD